MKSLTFALSLIGVLLLPAASPLEDIPGSNTVYTAAETDTAISNAISSLPPSGVTSNDVRGIVTNVTEGAWIFTKRGTIYGDEGPITEFYIYAIDEGNVYWWHTHENGEGYMARQYEENIVEFEDDGCVMERTPSRNALGLARLEDLPALTNGLASAASVSAANSRAANAQSAATAASNTAASVAGTVTAWETYWDGDEVRVTVTNYDSQVHLPSLYIEQKLENTNAYRTVWDERTRWASNSVEMAALRAALDEKADRAWGYYESHTGEYAPDGYTWLSSPRIAIAGGLAYQRTLTTSGAIWVLASNGLVAETGGDSTNGFFRIKDDEGNTTFEIVRGNKRTVGATAAGIKVTQSGGSTSVTIPYNVVSEAAPTLYGTTDLASGEWTQLSPTWTGQSGAWTGTVTTASSRYFIKGEYETGGETYIRNAAPISAESGIYCTDGIHKVRPVYNSGSITWELVTP